MALGRQCRRFVLKAAPHRSRRGDPEEEEEEEEEGGVKAVTTRADCAVWLRK
jgi:hypothetical protein